jgi:hypothetical protein
MHVKCIYVICSLLCYIPIYLQLILIFYLDLHLLWGLFKRSLYFGSNSVWLKNLMLVL